MRLPPSALHISEFLPWLHTIMMEDDGTRCESDWIHEYSLTDDRPSAMWIMPRRAGATTLGMLACLRVCVEYDYTNVVYLVEGNEDKQRVWQSFSKMAKLNFPDRVQSVLREAVTFRTGSRCDIMTIDEFANMPAVEAMQYSLGVIDTQRFWIRAVRQATLVLRESEARVVHVISTNIDMKEEDYRDDEIPKGRGRATVYNLRDHDSVLRPRGVRGRPRFGQGNPGLPESSEPTEGPKSS